MLKSQTNPCQVRMCSPQHCSLRPNRQKVREDPVNLGSAWYGHTELRIRAARNLGHSAPIISGLDMEFVVGRSSAMTVFMAIPRPSQTGKDPTGLSNKPPT
jgi:putative salt-induced outer membrane protein YdiY